MPFIDYGFRRSRHINLFNLLLQHIPPSDHLFGHILPCQLLPTYESLRLLLDLHVNQLTRPFPQNTIDHDIFDVTGAGVHDDGRNRIVLRSGDHPRRGTRKDGQVRLLALCDASDLVTYLCGTGTADGGEVKCLFYGVVDRQGGYSFGEEFLFRGW